MTKPTKEQMKIVMHKIADYQITQRKAEENNSLNEKIINNQEN
jgi:hypothetical protein